MHVSVGDTDNDLLNKTTTKMHNKNIQIFSPDINECQINNHDCVESQRCDNTIGSYTCVRNLYT